MKNVDIDNFNGFLMSKDIKLAEIKNGEIATVLNEELLPLYIKKTKYLKTWLEKRSIDSHRTNSRLLKKVLRLRRKDDISTALSVNAVTITDTYWVKPENSTLTWEDVKFKENYFSNLALKGDLSAYSQKPSRTPELTNTGSFEKCWKLEDGHWYLYKVANQNELFSELFIYHLGKELGFPMAHYESTEDGYIKTKDFTDNASVNFEPAFNWMLDNEDYIDNYKALEKYGTEITDQYLQILLLDSYCLNGDRHTFNYGVLRDVDTGEVLSLAPNFDNNIALLSGGYLPKVRKYDVLSDMLSELEEETGAYSDYLTRNPIPIVTPEMIDRCIDATGCSVDREYIKHFILTGYNNSPIADITNKKLDVIIANAEQSKTIDSNIPISKNSKDDLER